MSFSYKDILKPEAELPAWAKRAMDEIEEPSAFSDEAVRAARRHHRMRAIDEVARDFNADHKHQEQMLSVLMQMHEEATAVGPGRDPTSNLNHVMKRFGGIVVLAAHSADSASRTIEKLTKALVAWTVMLFLGTFLLVWYTVELRQIAKSTDDSTKATAQTLQEINSRLQQLASSQSLQHLEKLIQNQNSQPNAPSEPKSGGGSHANKDNRSDRSPK